jgi:hypothetical protein
MRLVRYAVIAAAAVSLAATGTAQAANSPTTRDCSFSGGLDPDFVQISRVSVNGSDLTVSRARKHVSLKASESSLPGDQMNGVTLHAKVKSPGTKTKKVSGNGTGVVKLKIPLKHRMPGRAYTISWAATFDNGNHMCPSSSTPANTTPMPFKVRVRSAPYSHGARR